MSRISANYRKLCSAGALAYVTAPLLLCGPASSADEACALKRGPVRTVVRINGSDSVTLDDGSELKLAGTLGPRAADGSATPGAWPAETRATTTLTAMLLGQTVELAFGATRTDRYGRHIAHLFLGTGQNRIWVQGALLSSGHVRAHATPGTTDCLPELLAHERVARQSRLGLWQIGFYRSKAATRIALLMYLRSSFQIVAGRVVSVSQTKTGTYLNFGENWRQDFTIQVSKSVLSAHPEWAAELDNFKDKYVEVRGWIERRNGPMIVISHPGEIEILPEGLSQRYRSPRSGAQAMRAPLDTAPKTPSNDETPAPKEERPEPKAPGAVDL